MKISKLISCLILISAMLFPISMLETNIEVTGVPDEHPISLSGGYLKEIDGTNRYVDHLQPGDTESYKIHLINDNDHEVHYLLTVSDIPIDWTVFLDNGKTSMNINMPTGPTTEDLYLYLKNPTPGTGDIEIKIKDKNTQERWKVTMEIICESGPIKLTVPSTQYSLGQDTPYGGSFTLENIGSRSYDISLDMENVIPAEERIDGEWTVIFSDNDFLLPEGAKTTIAFTIWAPSTSLIGDKRISAIVAMVEGITRPFTTPDIDIAVTNIYDLRAVVLPLGYQKVEIGGQAEFNLTLENWAKTTDHIRIREESIPSGWSFYFDDPFDPTTTDLPISPGSSRTFHPIVTLPINAIAGMDEVILIAEGNANTTLIVLSVEVLINDDFLASVTNEILGGKGGVYELTLGSNQLKFNLQNRGNYYDTVSLFIDQSPEWGHAYFSLITIGPGSIGFETDGGAVNLSGYQDLRVEVLAEDLQTLDLTFSPYQTAVIVLDVNIPMDSPARNGVISIIYNFGRFSKQQYFQMSVKLNLLNLEIVDRDGNGIADLELYPSPDYDIGDTMHFSFSIRNHYPFSPSDVIWKIFLLEPEGVKILEGDIGEIEPGETRDFNVSWKVDRSTRAATIHLVLESPSYPPGSTTPSATSKEEFTIYSTDREIPWGLVVLVIGIGISVIVVFSYLYFTAQERKRIREESERKEYDGLYGHVGHRALRGGNMNTDELRPSPVKKGLKEKMRRPSLPPKEVKAPTPTGKKKDRRGKEDEDKGKKSAPILGSPEGKKRISYGKKHFEKKPHNNVEDLPEFEDIE